MKIIPAIDIIEGKCVRLSQGVYQTKKIYNQNPLDVAKNFFDHGIRNLHLVDLDGARSNKSAEFSKSFFSSFLSTFTTSIALVVHGIFSVLIFSSCFIY